MATMRREHEHRPTDQRFVVTGEASSQLPLRLMGLFAQQGLIPLFFELRRGGTGITVSIVQDQLDPHRASIILEKMLGLIDVDQAQLL